jgi:hypothetical protein
MMLLEKAERYAYEPVDEISHNIISGKMTLPEVNELLRKVVSDRPESHNCETVTSASSTHSLT